jgi:hypothetical protein
MAATAAAYLARGMNHVQAQVLATLVEGVAAGQAGILISAGFPVPLANELIAQMVLGAGIEKNLAALGMPHALASLVAADITATDAE